MKKKVIIGILVIVVIIIVASLGFIFKNSKAINNEENNIVSDEKKSGPQKLTSVITKENYGDYIDYKYDYNGNGDNTDDWRIFYNDGENVYLIASEAIPEILEPEEKNYKNFDFLDERLEKHFSFAKEYDKGSIHFTEAMNSTALMLDLTNWESFVNENADYAIGGPTLEMVLKQYNEINDIKIDYKISKYGYETKTNYQLEELSVWEIEQDFSEINDLYDTKYDDLYSYPYFGMNIASPTGDEDSWHVEGAYKDDRSMLYVVSTNHERGTQGIYDTGGSYLLDYKPIICLKADTIGEKTDGVWNIK